MNNYSAEKWINRYRYRSDIGAYLTHLTKPNGNMTSVDVLIKILNEKKLIGSGKSGYVSGDEKAVCFQDTPLYGIAQNLQHEEQNRNEFGGKIRYKGVGLLVPKPYIFKLGGRPVIYETKELANKLFPDTKWRIVTMDFSDNKNIVDWSHEREWRIKGDFEFDISKVFVIVSDTAEYKKFIEKADQSILSAIRGIVTLEPVLS